MVKLVASQNTNKMTQIININPQSKPFNANGGNSIVMPGGLMSHITSNATTNASNNFMMPMKQSVIIKNPTSTIQSKWSAELWS